VRASPRKEVPGPGQEATGRRVISRRERVRGDSVVVNCEV
jgi:hypothetical protein